MKLFEPNLNSSSYTIPIIKLIVSVLIIIACVFRKSIFGFENKSLRVIVSVAAFLLTIVCIVIAYISCCEIYATFFELKCIQNLRFMLQLFHKQGERGD